MKDIKEMSFDKAITEVKNLLKKIYNQFEFIREKLNEGELIEFDNIWLGKNDENLKSSLLNLATFLKKYYNQKVIVLIDEYDTPLISAYRYGYYNEAKNFFSNLYGSVLKDNTSL